MILRLAAGLWLLAPACGDAFGWKQAACDEAKGKARDAWETAAQALPAEVKAQQDKVSDALRAESEARRAFPRAGTGYAAASSAVTRARLDLRRRARGRDYDDALAAAEKMARGEPAVTFNYLSRPAYALATALREQKRLDKEKDAARKAMDEEEAASPPPDAAPLLDDAWADVSAGSEHTCAVKRAGWISCWGDNLQGQSSPAYGTFTHVASGAGHSCALFSDATLTCWGDTAPTPPVGIFRSISAGEGFACGLRDDGHAVCWGALEVASDRSSLAVDAGRAHACALDEQGTATCWGSDHLAPPGPYTALSAGDDFTCALRAEGELACWGAELAGRTQPPAGRFLAVSAGGDFACALAEDGTLRCWGGDRYGETRVPAGRFVQVSCGPDHACALDEAGTMRCWGRNHVGQAGDFWTAG